MKKLSIAFALGAFCLGLGIMLPHRADASACSDECAELLTDCAGWGTPAQCSQLWHACMTRCRGH